MITNYHTHTHYCDGRAEAFRFVEEAIHQGVVSLGFSTHAPVNFPTGWTIDPKQTGDYHAEIHRLKREYAERIDIFCGLEADFFNHGMPEIQALYAGYKWDYIIGSIHFIDGIRPNGQRWCIDGPHEDFLDGWRNIMDCDPLLPVREYFEVTRKMVRQMKPDIIGHLDKIKMQSRPDCIIPDTHPFFREQLMATLEEIAAANCIVEINTRGIQKGLTDYFPGRAAIAEMQKMGIPVTISSDAHTPNSIKYGFEQAEKFLMEVGYRTARVFRNGKWEERNLELRIKN